MGFYIDVLKPSLVGFPPYLQRPFITNWCWILSNTFSLSADEIIWLFFCSLCIWWIVWLDLNVDPALHFCSKPCSYRIWNTHTHTHTFFLPVFCREILRVKSWAYWPIFFGTAVWIILASQNDLWVFFPFSFPAWLRFWELVFFLL